MRLIDAEELEKLLVDMASTEKTIRGIQMNALCFAAVKSETMTPTIDAVPVVRCKDCKWWKRFDIEEGIRYGDCTNPRAIIRKDAIPSERYFCPDGERRDGGDDDANGT